MGYFNKREIGWFGGFLGLSILAGYYLGGSVEMKAQIALFDHMLKISAIVLGVAGVWIGVLHSDELRAIDSSSQGNLSQNSDSIFGRLVRLVLWSTFVVCLSLAVLIWGEAILSATSLGEHKIVRAIFFALVSLVALIEIYLLLMSLLPLSDLDDKTRLEKKQEERRQRDQSRRG